MACGGPPRSSFIAKTTVPTVLVEYEGSDNARLEGIAVGKTVNVSGEMNFEVASNGESPRSTSERIHQGGGGWPLAP